MKLPIAIAKKYLVPKFVFFLCFCRKRSEYRRPSQMGVPDIQFHKKQFDYQPHRLQQKPEKSKVTNNNMFGNSNKGSNNNNNNGEPFVSESKRSYEDRSATAFKEARAKLSRPKTNIKSDVDSSDGGGGSSNTPQKSVNRSDYGKDSGPIERTEKIRPSSNLKNEGSRAWDTGRNEFATAQQKPLKASKMNDNLVPDAEGQMDKTSLNRSEYGKDGPMQKPEKIKPPNSNLKNEGILILAVLI